MSKTNDTPNFSHGTKDHGTLADGELDAVTGGTKATVSNSWLGALAAAMGKMADDQARSR